MCDRSMWPRYWGGLVLAALVVVAIPVSAERLTKEDREWLQDVETLILPEEEKVFRDLSAEDRPELVKLFWARRNPNGPGAETNPAREQFEKERAEAKERFGRHGAGNDCMQMLLLLGEPDREGAKARAMVQGPGREGTHDEVLTQWVYHTIRGMSLSEDLAIGFDERCRMNESTRRSIRSSLQPQLAAARVLHPSIEIRLDEKKRLVPLASLLPQEAPGETPQPSLRQDFPIADEVVFMRSGEGEAALLGVLEGRLEGVAADAPLKVKVVAETLSAEGKVVATSERDASVQPAADGSFDVAFGFVSKPGPFTLRAGIVEPDSQRTSVVTHAIEVPDYSVPGLMGSTPMFLEAITPVESVADDDPLAPFVMGPYRLVPRVGRSFSKAESMLVVCNFYGGQADAATGKSSVAATLGFFKDGKPFFRRMEQTVPMSDGTFVYGPVPLRGFAPGRYHAEILITDAFSKQEHKVTGSFEVTP